MSMSIFHVITTIDMGGAEKQLLTLATEQVRRGNSVHVIYLKGSPTLFSQFTDAGVIVHKLFEISGLIPTIFNLRNIAKKGSVVHAHLPRSELLCAVSLPKKTFVVTRHNAELFYPGGPRTLSRILSHFVLKRSNGLICISNEVKSFLIRNGEFSTSVPCQVIYYGLAQNKTLNHGNNSKKPQLKTIGTVARLVPQKNLSLLLKVASELKSRKYNFRLAILGQGQLKDTLYRECIDLEISDIVDWSGVNINTQGFYSKLDVFVLTSNYEGFGLVLLEAMQNEVPIVARNRSAIPEVLGYQHPGLVDSIDSKVWADRIIELLKNGNDRLKFLSMQKKRLECFDIAKTYEAHNKLYSEFLSELSRISTK